VVIGGGQVAERKAIALFDAGAELAIVSPRSLLLSASSRAKARSPTIRRTSKNRILPAPIW